VCVLRACRDVPRREQRRRSLECAALARLEDVPVEVARDLDLARLGPLTDAVQATEGVRTGQRQ